MHPRNPYRNAPDFRALAESYPPLRSYLITTTDGSTALNFKDPQAQRCLTEALLNRDFGLTLELPPDRLCPPVPNRLNYVLWIQDLLSATCSSPRSSISPRFVGLDIGTGASAIYPLLACAIEREWLFIGTEIDETSFKFATTNVASNQLSERISIQRARSNDPLLFPLKEPRTFSFCMCNPPFYGSTEEIEQSAKSKKKFPWAVCTGSPTEMITDGGETAFVCRMVRESLEFRDRCGWYTSMLGKISSVLNVVAFLKQSDIDNYGITEFIQGQTRRWAVVWSFGDARLPDSLARIRSESLQNVMPAHNTLRQPLPTTQPVENVWKTLMIVLSVVKGVDFDQERSRHPDHDQNGSPLPLRVEAQENSWSRAARRKNAREAAMTIDADVSGSSARTAALVCSFEVVRTKDSKTPLSLSCQWTRGQDRALYESFWSHICRKLLASL